MTNTDATICDAAEPSIAEGADLQGAKDLAIGMNNLRNNPILRDLSDELKKANEHLSEVLIQQL